MEEEESMRQRAISTALSAVAVLGDRLFAPGAPAERALISGGDRVAAQLRRLADHRDGWR
jgi:hypothetical protein